MPYPTYIDTLENGDIVKYEPYHTELFVFNADSIVNRLFQNNITNITQLSEETIQAKLIKKGKKKGEYTYQSLPQASHDCNGTIVIYGAKNISATYRGVLIEERDLHIIPALKIFYLTKQIVINATKYYQ